MPVFQQLAVVTRASTGMASNWHDAGVREAFAVLIAADEPEIEREARKLAISKPAPPGKLILDQPLGWFFTDDSSSAASW